MRSVLEYSSSVYHSQLTKFQENLLEKMQKRVLRLIYGYDLSYQQLLNVSSLESLTSRRESNLKKFAEKTQKNTKYTESWFPPNQSVRHNRFTNPYLEETTTGNRLYKSPIFAMRRLLNGNHINEDIDLTGLFNDPWASQHIS